MFLRICDNNYCSANLDIIVNALLTFTVIFLVLKRLESIRCDRWAAGDIGRECPCSPKKSTTGPIVPHDPGQSSQVQVQSLPDWWHLKALALEKLRDISRPLNPSKIWSPRPHLKFQGSDAHAHIDQNVVPSFDCPSSSYANEVTTLQKNSAADSSKLGLAKPTGPLSQDGRGWVLRNKRGWTLAKKNPNAPSDRAESIARSPPTASPVNAPVKKKSEHVHVKSSLVSPTPAAESNAASLTKDEPRDISASGFSGTPKSVPMRQNAAGSFTPPSTTSWAQRKTKPSGSSTPTSLKERTEKWANASPSSSPRSSIDRRKNRENRTAENSGSGYSSRPSSSASTRPHKKQVISSRSAPVDCRDTTENHHHSPGSSGPFPTALNHVHVVLACSSTRVTRLVPRQTVSDTARMHDASSSAFDSCALDAHVQMNDVSRLSTPSTSEDFYSLPTSSASSASSKTAVTVDHSLRSGTGSSTPTTDLRIGDGNLIHSAFSEQGPPPTTEDAGGITEDEPKGTGLSRHSPRSSAESESHFLPLPAGGSRRISNSWSSRGPPPPEALHRSTVEPFDPATANSPTSPPPALLPSPPPSAGQLVSDFQQGHIRSQMPNPGLSKSSCCQLLPVNPSRPTSSSGLPTYFSDLTTVSVCSPAQYVHDASVDNNLLISHTTYVAEGLLRSNRNKKPPLSNTSGTSYPLLRNPARASSTRSGGTKLSNEIGTTTSTEMNPARRTNVWEPGAWPCPGQPRGCERYEKTAKRQSRRSATHGGLPRLAAASVGKQHRQVGERKVSFNQEGKSATKLREQQSTDAARRIYMEYADQVLQNSPAQPLPNSSIQGSARLAPSGGLQTTSPALAQLFYEQGRPYNPSRGWPMIHQRSPTAGEGGEPMKPMLLDYQGYPVPPCRAMHGGSILGTSNQHLDCRGCAGISCVDFCRQHAACSTNYAGYPVAPLVNNQGCALAPSAVSRVHPHAFSPNYRGCPSLLYQCYRGYSAAPEMTCAGQPPGNFRTYEARIGASTTNPQAHPASSLNNFRRSPETSSMNYRGIAASSSMTDQGQPLAVSRSTCSEHPTFPSNNRRRRSKSSHIEDHDVSDTRNQKHRRTLSAFYSEHPNLSCETGVQLEGEGLSKRPLEVQDLKANSTSVDETLGIRIPQRLAKTDAENVELATQVPEKTSTPPSQSQLEQKTAPQVRPIPGDVVILFSGLLPSADREATFVYFHPNQSTAEPEPRKGNMAADGENDQRALLIRYGEFDRNGIWTPNIQVKLFYTAGHDVWRFVTKTFVTTLPWLHRSRRPYVRLQMPDPHFKPRSGDLIVRTALTRSAARELEVVQQQIGDKGWVLIWWDHDHLAITDDMIVRAYVGPAPKRNNQPSYSLLGRVEMYTKTDVHYLFMGRDQHTFSSESRPTGRRCSSQRLSRMLPTQFCCS